MAHQLRKLPHQSCMGFCTLCIACGAEKLPVTKVAPQVQAINSAAYSLPAHAHSLTHHHADGFQTDHPTLLMLEVEIDPTRAFAYGHNVLAAHAGISLSDVCQ